MGADRFRFVLDNATEGSITLLASTQNEPNGWDSVDFIFRRDERLHGVFFEFSTPFKFVRRIDDSAIDGFTYLKNIYDTQGIGAIVTIQVDYRESQFDDFSPADPSSTVIEGRINLTNAAFDLGNNEVTVNIEDNSAQAQFLELADNKIDLTAEFTEDGTTKSKSRYNALGYVWCPREVNVQSKTIRKTDDLEINPLVQLPAANYVLATAGTCTNHSGDARFEWDFQQRNLEELDLLSAVTNAAIIPFNAVGNAIWTAQQAGIVDIEIRNFALTYTRTLGVLETVNPATTTFKFYITKNNNQGAPIHLETTTSNSIAVPTLNLFNAVFNVVFPPVTVAIGDTIELYVELAWTACGTILLPPGFNNYNFFVTLQQNAQFIISQNLSSVNTPVNGHAIHETLNMLSTYYTNNLLETYSQYFGRRESQPFTYVTEGAGSLNILFNGLGLRGFPNTKGFFVDSLNPGPTTELKDHKGTFISWNDLFDSLNAIFAIGATFRDDADAGKFAIRIEEVNFFYPNTVVITLDNVDYRDSGWRQIVDESRYFNELELGYAKWESEDFSGLDEYNTKHTYKTGLTILKNKLSQLSTLVSGGYAIELTREQQFVETRGIDNDFDNDMFILGIDPAQWIPPAPNPPPYPPVVGSAIDSEKGIVTPNNVIDGATAINYRINPHYNLMRWLAWIGQGERIDITQIIATFQDAVGNYATGGSENPHPNPNANFGFIQVNQTEQANNGRVDPFIVPELIEFQHHLSHADYLALKASPLEQIEVSQTDTDHSKYYLKQIRYRIAKQSAQFTLIPRVQREAFAFDNALRFNNIASNQYVDLTNNALWNNIFAGGGQPKWSCSFWMNSHRTAPFGVQTIISKRNTFVTAPDPISIFLQFFTPNLEIKVAVTQDKTHKFEVRTTNSPIVQADGVWYHVAITHDATLAIISNPLPTTTIYVDGVALATTLSVNTGTDPVLVYAGNVNPMEMGTTTNLAGNRFAYLFEILDEFAIWNRVITPAEVAQLYNGGAGSYADLISGIQVYYRMNSTAAITPLTAVDKQGVQNGDLPLGLWGATGDWVLHV